MKALYRLNHYFWKYKFHFFPGILFIILSNFFAIYPAVIIRQSLDLVIDNLKLTGMYQGSSLYMPIRGSLTAAIAIFGAVIVAMALIKGLFMFFMRQTIIVMSRRIEYDQKNEIFDHYQKLDLAFYKTNTTGDLMNRISEDVSRVRMYTGPAIMYIINLVVLFVLVIYQMLIVNVKLTLFVLLPLPLLSLAVFLVNSTILQRSERVQEQLSRLSSFVQEKFSGIRIIKAYNRLKYYGFEFEQDAQSYLKKNLDLVKFNAIFFPMIMLLIGLSTLLTIWIGGIEVANGRISPGVIVEFIMYVNMLTFPVAMVGWVTSMIQRAAASQKRINEFLLTEPAIKNTHFDQQEIQGKIEFRNVTFTYPDTGIVALKDLSFSIPAGKTLAVLGRTGSGKSTIAQLINRFYDVQQGDILLDDKSLKEHNLSQVRMDLGYVPQEVFLFSDTIRNNISFGIFNSTEESIIQAAKDADVYHNIIQFPEGFDTKIGERGITLSGGQKQRISIARAIIKRPKILIFDDCLSAVDTETEEKILNSLLRIMKGRTSLIISHRISTVKTADHIIVLDDGEIVEEGDHHQLMNKKSVYFELYQKQLMEATLENG